LKRAIDRISRLKKGDKKKDPEQPAFEFTVAEDRFEQESVDFHRKIRESYLSLANQEPERFRVIDGSNDIQTIHQEVAFHLAALIEREG